MPAETHVFQTEVQKLLDLMIHSLYTNKDVFLRELISNASDALNRRRFAGLTDASLLTDAPLEVRLRVDAEARTLSIIDNGIGMSKEEVMEHLGTIARSGTLNFIEELEKSGSAPAKEGAPDLIGQFGVGFYSSFMVADEVVVSTRKAGEERGTQWVSKGDGRFTLDDADCPEVGTSIRLQLKKVDGDAGISDYTNEWVLRQIVKRYSDFVAYPIVLEVVGAPSSDSEEETAPSPATDEPLNSMKAIWTRAAEDVSEEEHAEFYKHIAHDWNDPLIRIATRIEGTFEASALLYVPTTAPVDLYHQEMAHRGIQLYVRRVFIMDECRELMPEWLRFVKGVVDAEDISLNVSREMLQQDRQIQAIRRHLVKRVLEELAKLAEEDEDKYLGFWAQFGPVLKEGLLGPGDDKDKQRIYELMRVSTTRDDRLHSLADVIDRMPEGQEVIYSLCGPSRDILMGSPHLEAFVDKDIEVILFSDTVDEVWSQQMPSEFRGKRWQSVGRGEAAADLETEEDGEESKGEKREEQEAAYRDLVTCLRAAVQEKVREVRLSHRLTSSPACLVVEEGDLSPRMGEILRRAGQEVPDVKPILEVNPDHSLLVRLQEIFAADGTDPRLRQYAELLYGQALLAEGGRLEDPAAFSRTLADVMERAL